MSYNLGNLTMIILGLEERKNRVRYLQSGYFLQVIGSFLKDNEDEIPIVLNSLLEFNNDRIPKLNAELEKYDIRLKDDDQPIEVPIDKTMKFKLGLPVEGEFTS